MAYDIGSACAVHTHHARSAQAARMQHATSTHASRTQRGRIMRAARTQHARRTHAARSQHARSMRVARAQQGRSTHAALSWHARSMHPALSLPPPAGLRHPPRHSVTCSSVCCCISHGMLTRGPRHAVKYPLRYDKNLLSHAQVVSVMLSHGPRHAVTNVPGMPCSSAC